MKLAKLEAFHDVCNQNVNNPIPEIASFLTELCLDKMLKPAISDVQISKHFGCFLSRLLQKRMRAGKTSAVAFEVANIYYATLETYFEGLKRS